MSHRDVAEIILLSLVVLSCWFGAVGMWRMREPMQALHYLSFPACVGSSVLVLSVFVQTGSSQAAWKTLLICLVLLASNSVVTHATARAFRTRQLGHWEPRPGDPAEFVPATPKELPS
jgi:multicomponent Na+:H+ antiporter subunit G